MSPIMRQVGQISPEVMKQLQRIFGKEVVQNFLAKQQSVQQATQQQQVKPPKVEQTAAPKVTQQTPFPKELSPKQLKFIQNYMDRFRAYREGAYQPNSGYFWELGVLGPRMVFFPLTYSTPRSRLSGDKKPKVPEQWSRRVALWLPRLHEDVDITLTVQDRSGEVSTIQASEGINTWPGKRLLKVEWNWDEAERDPLAPPDRFRDLNKR